jgi:hypothetical protein
MVNDFCVFLILLLKLGAFLMLNSLQSLLSICLGIILIVFGAGEILLRLLMVVIGLLLINYGLRLRGAFPLQVYFLRIRRIFWV